MGLDRSSKYSYFKYGNSFKKSPKVIIKWKFLDEFIATQFSFVTYLPNALSTKLQLWFEYFVFWLRLFFFWIPHSSNK